MITVLLLSQLFFIIRHSFHLSAVNVLDCGLPEEEIHVVAVLHRPHEVRSYEKKERRQYANCEALCCCSGLTYYIMYSTAHTVQVF